MSSFLCTIGMSLGITLSGCSDTTPACQVAEQHRDEVLGNAGCLMVHDGKMLVIRHRFGGKLGLPGGIRQGNETAQCTAHRETYEETGYNVIVGRQLRHWSDDFLLYECHLQSSQEPVAEHVPVPSWARLEVTDIQWLSPGQIAADDWRIPGQIPELAGIIRWLEKK